MCVRNQRLWYFVGLITGKLNSNLLSVLSDTVMTSPVQLMGSEHSWFLFMTPRVQICVQTPGTLTENHRDFPNILQENSGIVTQIRP
jgi:hypothetical protein